MTGSAPGRLLCLERPADMEAVMGELTDKIKGNVNEAIGKAKEAIGEHNRDPNLAAEGEAQQAEGKGQQMKGKVKGALGDDI